MNCYLKVWQQYAGFSGRARRMEYWVFGLVNVLAFFTLEIIAIALSFHFPAITFLTLFLLSGCGLAVLIPSLAVSVRRLHDTGHSGWWFLIAFIPLIGAIILLVFYPTDGDQGYNQWGPNPKQHAAWCPKHLQQ